MKITLRQIRPFGSNGFALIITMIFLAITLMAFASMMYWVSSSTKVTTRNNLFNASQAAAEGAVETVISQMDRDFLYQSLNSTNVYQALTIPQTGWPMAFSFSGTNGLTNLTVIITPQMWGTNWELLNSSQFAGLYAALADCQVGVTATPQNQGQNLSATVVESFQLASIPIFQYGVFYNMDMDFISGQPLTMNGKVMVNGNIWMYPQATATFNDTVSATLLVTNADDPNDQQGFSSYTSPIIYNGGNPVSGVDSLVMPIAGANNNPTNVEAMLNLPPPGLGAPNAVAYAPSNQVYLYNAADLIISNSISGTNSLSGGSSPTGTNLFIYYQDPGSPVTAPSTGHLTQLTNDFYILKIAGPSGPYTNYVSPLFSAGKDCYTNVLYAGWSFVTNVAFYDYRESATVQAVQINVAAFNKWLTNTYALQNGVTVWNDLDFAERGHGIDSIYVYNSVPLTSTQLPAVRVVNGAQLPYTTSTANPGYTTAGLTVATPMPIYVLGNYNTQTNNGGGSSAGTTNTLWTRPAALMGDAITVLSGSWQDSWTSGTGFGSRGVTSNDTVNAACLEGIVQSVTVGGNKHYSGGLENFLRLIEDWSGKTLTYNGSIVVMFPSIYATNYWQPTGNYYNAPTRNWGFDVNFMTQAKLPPLTPQVKQVVRGQWGNWVDY